MQQGGSAGTEALMGGVIQTGRDHLLHWGEKSLMREPSGQWYRRSEGSAIAKPLSSLVKKYGFVQRCGFVQKPWQWKLGIAMIPYAVSEESENSGTIAWVILIKNTNLSRIDALFIELIESVTN